MAPAKEPIEHSIQIHKEQNHHDDFNVQNEPRPNNYQIDTSTTAYYSELDHLLLNTSSDSVQLTTNSEQKYIELLEEEIKRQNREMNIVKKNLFDANNRMKNYKAAVEKCFTKSQIQTLTSGQCIRHWAEEDIISSLSLRSLGLKTYRYLREHCNFPLPGVSSLNRWLSDINVEPGILNSVIRLMSIRAHSFTEGEKACIMSFDEMKIESKYCYDKGSDRIYKPHKSVQVVMLRGIMGNWKQPVYYGYDAKMTKSLLYSIIEKVEAVGYKVHATVCDMGGANVGLLTSLGITTAHPSFQNPYDVKRLVHVFADPPHLIKLIRNNILDNTIHTPLGNVNAEPLKELVKYQSGEFKLAPKVSHFSLIVKGPDRQKVKTAAQLLSQTTSTAIKYLGNEDILYSHNWKQTADFIELVDQWFDVMNSAHIKGEKMMRSGYKGESFQVDVLKKMIDIFSQTTVGGRKYQFIKGIIYSSKSLINLFSDLKSSYNFKYLLTRRLNQDILENSFGILRQMGSAHDHPDPISFKYRMRRFILSRKHVLVAVNPNTTLSNKDEFIAEGLKCFKENSSPLKKCITDDEETMLELDDSVLTSNLLDGELQEDEKSPEFVVPNKEVEGFSYALGYVVRKFGKKYRFLASSEENEKDWIAYKNKKGLSRMDPSVRTQFLVIEKLFKNHHGKTLVEGHRAVSGIVQIVKRGIDIPTDVIEYFVRWRTYIRAKHLNQAMKNNNYRRKMHKLKKIVPTPLML